MILSKLSNIFFAIIKFFLYPFKGKLLELSKDLYEKKIFNIGLIQIFNHHMIIHQIIYVFNHHMTVIHVSLQFNKSPIK